MTTHKDLKEVLGRIRGELLHPEVFKDEEIDACELLDQIAALAGGLGLGNASRRLQPNACSLMRQVASQKLGGSPSHAPPWLY